MENQPRVLIKKENSKYYGCLGHILLSNADATFRVKVWIEGSPIVNLEPSEIEPC